MAAAVHIAKHLLEEHGIPCFIKHEHLTWVVPPLEAPVELWVMRDDDEPAARRLLESAEA
jgi:hypothetical protein